MKMKYLLINSITALVIIILTLPIVAFAKNISLYDQPQSNGKVIATVDLSAGIIPVYQPKEGGWIKVADPKNGNVGWAKASELMGSSQTTFTYMQRMGNDKKSPTTYQVIQFGQPTKLTDDQALAMVKQMRAKQLAFEKSMQTMLKEMNQLFYNDRDFMHAEHFPILMPLVILPVQKTTTTTQPVAQLNSSAEKNNLKTKK